MTPAKLAMWVAIAIPAYQCDGPHKCGDHL